MTMGHRVDRPGAIARTLFTAVLVILQIPVQVFALITNPAGHTILALAQLARRHRGAAFEGDRNTSRITITLLTGWIIVKSFTTLVTLWPIKVTLTDALSFRVTGGAM